MEELTVALQPNIELETSNLPRPVVHPASVRRWRPSRPRDLLVLDDVPSDPALGTTGPDPSYALRLAETLELELGRGESLGVARVGVAAIAAVRAARFGKVPPIDDAKVGTLILGYVPQDVPAGLLEELAMARKSLLSHVKHSISQALALMARVPGEMLDDVPAHFRARLAVGERLLA